MSTKIIDILNKLKAEDGGNSAAPALSLEYFPPRSAEGVANLKDRMDRMKETVKPIFADITWGAGGSTSDLSMELAIYMQQQSGMTANLHMTCTNMAGSADPVADIRASLQQALSAGVVNIVALRGDPPAGETDWQTSDKGFNCALDLVKFIRAEFGDAFGISVAGYPEGHPVAISEVKDCDASMTDTEQARCSVHNGVTYTCRDADYAKELAYLKQKVDAGADFIITQMFFDTAVYQQFVKDCRVAGIACPIVPGLMCITATAGFFKMTGFCKTRVPEALAQKLNELSENKEAVKKFGIEFGAQQCKDILASEDPPPVLHFYTLNLEKVVYGVLIELGLLSAEAVAAATAANNTNTASSDDAASQAAGSAWARVGDTVSSIYGSGVVLTMDEATGTAGVQITSWRLANAQTPTAHLQKGHYKKVF